MTQILSNAHRRLNMADLRRYNDEVQKIITQAVCKDGALYSFRRSGIVLFGVDSGGKPTEDKVEIDATVKGGHDQLPVLRSWYERAIVGQREVHSSEPKPTPPTQHPGTAFHRPATVDELVGTAEDATWRPYANSAGEVDERIERLDGREDTYRCIECGETFTSPKSIQGHVRMAHGDRGSIDSPEAKEKAVETKRSNRLERAIREAVAVLGAEVDAEEIARLRAENADLKARLAILREALDL